MPEKNFNNFMYTADIHVGTPPQKISAMFDTGSCNVWVMSQETIDKAEGGNPINTLGGFNQKLSTTFKDHQRTEKLKSSFGAGYIIGGFVRDQFMVGNKYDKDNQVVLGDYLFGLAT